MDVRYVPASGASPDVILGNREQCEILLTKPNGRMVAYRLDGNELVSAHPQGLEAPFEMLQAEKREHQRRRQQVVQNAVTTLFAAVVIALLALVLTGTAQLRVVLTGSMSGTYEVGDVLLVVDDDVVAAEVGDVIVFHYYDLARENLIADFSHRIVGGDSVAGFTTQGDANLEPDQSPVLKDDIVGVVVGAIPAIGWIIQPQWVIAILSAILIAILFVPEFSRKKRG